jgi:hypothetical protein
MRRKARVGRHEVEQPEDSSYRIIPLTQGKNALVDAVDYEWLCKWNWHASRLQGTNVFYAREHHVLMHRRIMGNPRGRVDHRDRNTLDNRRNNLRIATPSQNNQNKVKSKRNKSGFKGASWIASRKHWQATAGMNGKNINLGCFRTAREAARAYDAFASKHYGEFARLNFGGFKK